MTPLLAALIVLSAPSALSAMQSPGHEAPVLMALRVEGMTCTGCASAVRTALSNVRGVTDIAVSLENKIVRFKFDACCVPLQAVVKSVNGGSHNFRASVAFALPSVSEEKLGAVTQALSNVPGVSRVSRPSGDRLLLVELDGKKKTLLGDLTRAAKKVGMTLTPPSIQTHNLSEVK